MWYNEEYPNFKYNNTKISNINTVVLYLNNINNNHLILIIMIIQVKYQHTLFRT